MSAPEPALFLALLLIGLHVGVTTVLFGFGGGFVTVPVITVANAALGGGAVRVATATSALVMLINAVVATLATRREVPVRLPGRGALFVLLTLGGALGAATAHSAPAAVIRWGFVLYVAATVADLLARPGFLCPVPVAPRAARNHALPTWLGLPIGGIAAFLGVGGSVLTVPLMRRAGAPMPVAAALANPLTFMIVTPALLVSLLTRGQVPAGGGLVGSVDVVAVAVLLAGSLPVVVVMRRSPPRIPDALHAATYVVLLVAAGATVALKG